MTVLNTKESAAQAYKRMMLDRINSNGLRGEYEFRGVLAAQAVPAATTIWLNGQNGNTLYLPPDTVLAGDATILATASDGKITRRRGELLAVRTGTADPTGTLTLATAPTEVVAGTPTLAIDATEDALLMQFTPVAALQVVVSILLQIHSLTVTPEYIAGTYISPGN